MEFKKGDKVICRNVLGTIISYNKETDYFKVKEIGTNSILPFVNHHEMKLFSEKTSAKATESTNIKESILDHVIGVEEAAELWNLSSGYIKNLCAEGKIICKKIGKTWILDKTQINPSKSSE